MRENIELENSVSPQQIGLSEERGLRHRGGNANYGENEDRESFHEQVPLNRDEGKWAWALAVSCGIDMLLCSSTMMIVAFKYAYRDGGVSLLSMGFQFVSHWLSSLLLLLRLVIEIKSQASHVDQGLLLNRRRRTLYREQALSVGLGLGMMVSSCVILFKAFRKLRFWNKWYQDMDRHRMDKEAEVVSEWLAWTGFGFYVLHAALRCVATSKIRIQLLSHTGAVSIISLLYLFVLGMAAVNEKEWSWKAEPIAALVLVVVSLVEGIRIVFYYLDDMDTRLKQDDRG
jgi:hypothetical protein